MKKIITVLLAILMLAAMSVQLMAGPNAVTENVPVDVPKVSPTIDGNICGSEGWSPSVLMNYDTLGFFWYVNPLTMDASVQFAFDDEYFYYSANIADGLEAVHEITGEIIPAGYNEFIYSTGVDDIDQKSDGSAFGYNGDVFGMLIDPMGIFIEEGYTGNDDNTPWYMVGLFEGDVAKMYREKVNAGDITDKVKVAGRKTESGWCLEAGIPWDLMIEDIESITFGDCVIDKDELIANRSLIRAGAMYHDRFNDPEAGEVATWGCFVTVPTTMADGTPGNMGTGTNAMSLGLTLYLDNESAPDTTESDTTKPDDTTTAETEETEVVTDDKGEAVTDNKGNKVTQKVNKTTTKKAANGTSTGGNAAQTFDIGIAAALGALAVSAVGIAKVKRK